MWVRRAFISWIPNFGYVKHAVSHLGSSFSTNMLDRVGGTLPFVRTDDFSSLDFACVARNRVRSFLDLCLTKVSNEC